MRSFVSLLLALGIVLFIGCSHKKDNSIPLAPPTAESGRISIANTSGVSIVVQGYTQMRGTQSQQIQLWVRMGPNFNYYLRNIIDPGQSQLFPGGDRVIVSYYADQPDPSNPSQPLFSDRVDLTVNGSFVIQVKNGGQYSIFPG